MLAAAARAQSTAEHDTAEAAHLHIQKVGLAAKGADGDVLHGAYFVVCVCVCMCGRQEREHEAMVAEQAEQLRVLRGQYAEVRVLHDMSKYVRSWSRDPCVRAYAMQATARATAAEEHTARIDNENKRLQRELLRCGEECANVAHVCGHAVCLRNVCSGLELRQLHNTHLAAADSLGVHRRNPLLLQVVVALTGPWIFGSETKLV